MTDLLGYSEKSEADSPSVLIPGLSSEDVSRLAYACDVLETHASSDDYRIWASTTAEHLRTLLWDLANSPPGVVTGTDPSVIGCTGVYHVWPAETRRHFEHCGTCGLDVPHIVKIQNFGPASTLAICTAPGCAWSEIHEGDDHRGRATRRAERHVGIGPAVDDWGDPVEVLDNETQADRGAVIAAGAVAQKAYRHA